MRVTSAIFVCAVLLLCCACGASDDAGEAGTVAAQTDAALADPETPTAPKLDAAPVEVPEHLFEAVRRNPGDALAQRALAIALHGVDRKREATEHFEEAARLQPTPRHLLDLALAYASVGRVEESEATYNRILEASPEHPVVLNNLGNLALQRGESDTAIDLYTRALATRPDYLLAQSHLGDALKQAGKDRDAYRAYEKVLTMEPTNPKELGAYDDALYQLASLDLSKGAHERAAKMLEQLLEVSPEHPSAHYAYGQALLLLGRETEAQSEFSKHMEILSRQKPKGPVATGE